MTELADVTGAVLAGGKGSRLGGVRKGLLSYRGETLIARTLRTLRSVCAGAIVVADEVAPWVMFGAPIVGDPIADRGAPGGLLAALDAATTPWVFLCGSDMPLLDGATIGALGQRRTAHCRAVVAVRDGRVEPLHAFWARESAGILESLIRPKGASFEDLLALLPHVRVPVEELGPDAARSFVDVDTPEELADLGITRPRGNP